MKKYSSITRVNSHRTSRNKLIIQAVLLAIVLIVFAVFIPKMFGGVASFIFTPIHAVETWFKDSSDSLPYFFRDRKELVDQIIELQQKPAGGVEAHLTIKRLELENDELRNQLNNSVEDRVLAGVIGRPNLTPYDVLVLDKGSIDGIQEGAPVFLDNQTVIGLIKSVHFNSAVVELISTPAFKATVYIFGPNIYTTAEGMGGGVIRVGVPQGIEINEGDLVVLPGVNPGIFGEISAIESSPTQPEQFGFVTTKVPLNSIRFVTVGQNSLSPITFDEARENVKKMYTELFTVPVPEGVLVDIFSNSTSTATSTATTTSDIDTETL